MSNAFERSPCDVPGFCSTCNSDDCSSSVWIPVRRSETCKCGNNIHIPVVRNTQRERLYFLRTPNDRKSIPEPLDNRPRNENAAFHRIFTFVVLLPRDSRQQPVL